MKTYAMLGVLLLLTATGVVAREAGLEQFLIPPELVMRFQREIDLKPEQRQTITSAIGQLQVRVTELQWDMQTERQGMIELIRGDVVDVTAVVEQLDRVLAIENQVKKAHITMLVTIKNTLSAEQQARLRELRPEQPRDPPVGRR